MQALFGLSRRVGFVHRNMGKFFYAVQKGWKTGVFDTWDECQANVNKFPNARFKKFASQQEAWSFVAGGSAALTPKHNVTEIPVDTTAVSSASGNPSSIHHCPCCPVGQALKRGDTLKRSCEEVDVGATYQQTKKFKGSSKNKRGKTKGNSRSISNSASEDTPRMNVYTDGACTFNGRRGARAGIGVHWSGDSSRDISERLPGKQTNQRAELTAAIRAIEDAEERGISRVRLHTDSKYTINCVTDWIDRWKDNGWKTANGTDVSNKSDITKLDRLCDQVDVEWVYVPGHKNIPGNERADELARQGAAKPSSSYY